MFDPKRVSCEQKLKHCEHIRQIFIELHQGEYMRANRLESRVHEFEKMNAKLKRKVDLSEFPFKGMIG